MIENRPPPPSHPPCSLFFWVSKSVGSCVQRSEVCEYLGHYNLYSSCVCSQKCKCISLFSPTPHQFDLHLYMQSVLQRIIPPWLNRLQYDNVVQCVINCANIFQRNSRHPIRYTNTPPSALEGSEACERSLLNHIFGSRKLQSFQIGHSLLLLNSCK